MRFSDNAMSRYQNNEYLYEAGSFQTIQPLFRPTQDITNATITIDFGPFTPTTANHYIVQGNQWVNVTDSMISGNVLTLEGISIPKDSFFIFDLGNPQMPEAGTYDFKLSINGELQGKWNLVTFPSP